MPTTPSWPGFQYRIHIVGISPRTGTTLMARLMGAGFDVAESDQHETSIFDLPKSSCHILCSKRPFDILYSRMMLGPEKRLHVICLVRDPRDVIVSHHGGEMAKYWTSLDRWKFYYQALQRVRHHPRFLEVKYEDLIRDPDLIQRRLINQFAFLRLKRSFSSYPEGVEALPDDLAALHGLRHLGNQSVGSWRQNRERIKTQLHIHGDVQEELEALGYESNDYWKQ